MCERHQTANRLYKAARARSLLDAAKEQSSLARLLNVAPQNIHNWEVRGVSKQAALMLQLEFGFSATWILYGKGPMFIASAPATATMSETERELLNLFAQLGEDELSYLYAKAKRLLITSSR